MRALTLGDVRNRLSIAYGRTAEYHDTASHELRFDLYGVESLDCLERTLLALVREPDAFEIDRFDGDAGVAHVELSLQG